MLPPKSRPSGSTSQIHPDDAIRSTDDDAAASRLSAVNLGYLEDTFLSSVYKPQSFNSSFSQPGHGSGVAGPSTSRKPPLINHGTHHRSYAIDTFVDEFFGNGGRQVVSLGAGSDTRFWRLRSRASKIPIYHYLEIDFPHLTSLKAQRIARSPKLSSLLSDKDENTNVDPISTPTSSQKPEPKYKILSGGSGLTSQRYTILPVDLRDSLALEKVINEYLDPSLPTLVLAECVLCYMTTAESEGIWKAFRGFKECIAVVYEMCGLDDQFGQVMKRNLASRNLSLPGAVYPTPEAQASRFLSPTLDADTIFTRSGAKSLWQIRQDVIPKDELQRISRLEHLDEIEELRLVLSHYCIAWGSRGEVLSKVSL